MLNSLGNSYADNPTLRVPHNLDAEQALLGAILLDNRAFERASEYVTAEDFFDPLHGRIFDAAAHLIQSGRLASPMTLKTDFENYPNVREFTVPQYLGKLVVSATTVSGAKDYAQTIRELADLRKLLVIGQDLATDASSATAQRAATGIIEDAEAKLFEVAERSAVRRVGTISFSDAAQSAINATNLARMIGCSGLSTGIMDLDSKIGGLRRSDLIILAGRPSMGKTALATNIAVNVAKKGMIDEHGVEKAAPVGFFSLEMSAEQLATRILAAEASLSSAKIMRGQIDESEFRRLSDAASRMTRFPLYIDQTGGITIAQLTARARRAKRQYGIELLIVDYLQLLSGGKSRGDNRVQEITQITVGLKALAKELGIPVIALSQLSRDIEKRENKRPQLSDLRESGSIEQDADVVMFVFREEYYIERAKPDPGQYDKFREWQNQMAACAGKAEVILGKQRHGPIGTVELAFDASVTRFSDLARRDAP